MGNSYRSRVNRITQQSKELLVIRHYCVDILYNNIYTNFSTAKHTFMPCFATNANAAQYHYYYYWYDDYGPLWTLDMHHTHEQKTYTSIPTCSILSFSWNRVMNMLLLLFRFFANDMKHATVAPLAAWIYTKCIWSRCYNNNRYVFILLKQKKVARDRKIHS